MDLAVATQSQNSCNVKTGQSPTGDAIQGTFAPADYRTTYTVGWHGFPSLRLKIAWITLEVLLLVHSLLSLTIPRSASCRLVCYAKVLLPAPHAHALVSQGKRLLWQQQMQMQISCQVCMQLLTPPPANVQVQMCSCQSV